MRLYQILTTVCEYNGVGCDEVETHATCTQTSKHHLSVRIVVEGGNSPVSLLYCHLAVNATKLEFSFI